MCIPGNGLCCVHGSGIVDCIVILTSTKEPQALLRETLLFFSVCVIDCLSGCILLMDLIRVQSVKAAVNTGLTTGYQYI